MEAPGKNFKEKLPLPIKPLLWGLKCKEENKSKEKEEEKRRGGDTRGKKEDRVWGSI